MQFNLELDDVMPVNDPLVVPGSAVQLKALEEAAAGSSARSRAGAPASIRSRWR